MNTIYTATFGHSDADRPGQIALMADDDATAIAAADAFVTQGYRNGTWLNVSLSSGAIYGARNRGGVSVGRVITAASF